MGQKLFAEDFFTFSPERCFSLSAKEERQKKIYATKKSAWSPLQALRFFYWKKQMNAIIENKMKRASNNLMTTLKKLGAIGGLLLGLILLVAGGVLSALTFFENINFDNTELILITASFLLLGLGSHCLDLIEKERRTRRN